MNFLLDNNLPPPLAESLNALSKPDDHSVQHLRSRFAEDTPDIDWIRELARVGNWCVVTQDRLLRSKAEKEALRLSGLVTFVLKSGWRATGMPRHSITSRKLPSRIVVLETVGDSMSPTIESGERVLIDTAHTTPSPDGIYALRDVFGEFVIKRLQVLRHPQPRVRIISDNKCHEPEEVSMYEISVVGRVICSLKRL